MNKAIQPTIAPSNLGRPIKMLKAYGGSWEYAKRPVPCGYQFSWLEALDANPTTRMFMAGVLVMLALTGCASTPPERELSTKAPTRLVAKWAQSDEPGPAFTHVRHRSVRKRG